MKFKVGFLDRILIRDFLYIISAVGVIFSFFSIVLDVSENAKMIVGASMAVILLIAYIMIRTQKGTS